MSEATRQSEAPRLAILASGRGSNAEALMQAFASGFLPARLALVLSNRADAGVLQRARDHGCPTTAVVSRGLAREAHEAAVLEALQAHRVEHLLLAGYLRILSPFFLGRWPGAILNIHPSLLPEFTGLHAAARQWQRPRTTM